MEKTKITLKEVIALIPERTNLFYVDYRDSFDGNVKTLQECISDGTMESLYDSLNDWDDYEAVESEIKDLRTALENKYGIDSKESKEITDSFEDEIKEIIRDRDESTPIADMLKNTSKFHAHYDTGYWVESGSWSWNKRRINYEKKQIKKALGIQGINIWDNEIRQLLYNATGGGQLLIYFREDVKDLIQDDDTKSIEFSGTVWIGIVNHNEGSGNVESFERIKLYFPFNRKNLFLEESIKYNWTFSIAGMCYDWCDSTNISFSNEDIGQIDSSSTNEHLERERQYNETYKNGGCTYGDMDITRHRNTPYENHIPCGNRCTKCGTFWID